MRTFRLAAAVIALVSGLPASLSATPEWPGNRMIADYFRRETRRLHDAQSLAGITTLEQWTAQRKALREQMLEMLGLRPVPEKSDLMPVVTGRVEHAEFQVENLHFQSLPGLYVTANLYVPRHATGRMPAVVYVCGHAPVKQIKLDGVNHGAKAYYQHHGAWFARNGIVCLTIDTIQLGELEGTHHDTQRPASAEWNARGYTAGGVEAWNTVRAFDYLETRPEVDPTKFGLTGRSGGGAYTWFAAAIDERVKVAVPVAGMSDLQNQVVDGCVALQCPCMYVLNTYRWDYGRVAALIAPRALLIANSDQDKYFPLDGVVRIHREAAAIYRLYGAADNLGLLITAGPHSDTQDLQVPTFRWFSRFLKGDTKPVEQLAPKFFSPPQLRVFSTLPPDERSTKIHESFVPLASPAPPANRNEWQTQRESWMKALTEKSFRGWPSPANAAGLAEAGQQSHGDLRLTTWELESQDGVRLPLLMFTRGEPDAASRVVLHVLDEQGWADLAMASAGRWSLPPSPPSEVHASAPGSAVAALLEQAANGGNAVAFLAPRGIGPTAWTGTARERLQILRRFMLLGQTLEGMRVWDIRCAVDAIARSPFFGERPLRLQAERDQSVNTLYASLFCDGIAEVVMLAPPASHRTGPDYLNVLRFLDVPQAAAMAAERRPLRISGVRPEDWAWTLAAAKACGWPESRLLLSSQSGGESR